MPCYPYSVAAICRAYRVDDVAAFRSWLKENGYPQGFATRDDAKRAVGRYRAESSR